MKKQLGVIALTAALLTAPMTANASQPIADGQQSPDKVQICADAPPPKVTIVNHIAKFRPFVGETSHTLEPGGKYSLTTSKDLTASATLGATGTTEAGVVFAKVKAEVNASVTASVTVAKGQTFEQTNPFKIKKRVALGTFGVEVTTSTTYWVTPCTEKTQRVTNYFPINDVSLGFVS